MKIISTLLLICLSLAVYGQKNVIPVSSSSLTGVSLPVGTKQDKRIMYVAAAGTLLGLKAGEMGKVNEQSVEVFSIPLTAGGTEKTKLFQSFESAGFHVANISDDKDYNLVKGNAKEFLMYLKDSPSATDMYITALQVQQPLSVENKVISSPVSEAVIQNPEKANITDSKPVNKEIVQPKQTVEKPAEARSGFFFATTNFDDGWVSVAKQDWVETTKGNIRILIHYPNPVTDEYVSDPFIDVKKGWDILVAPKYSSVTNLELKPVYDWQSVYFAEADGIEKEGSKNVHIVLFRKNSSGSKGSYIEFITPDKATFENEFGPWHNSTSGWEKLENITGYNKFAVAPSDLSGKWTSNFSGMTQYVNAYTGANAGMDTHSSSETFEFGAENSYKWDINVASGFVGSIKFQNAKSAGKFTMPDNWRIYFPEMEGKPKTYNAWFSAVRGARILWIDNTGYGRKE